MESSEWSIAASTLDEAVSVDASTDIRPQEELLDVPGSMRLDTRKMSTTGICHIHQSLVQAGYELGRMMDEHENCHVYRARSLSSGREVVAKIIVEPRISSSSVMVRFTMEADVLATLEHPNLVRIVEHGAVSAVNFMILEFADGENLANQVLDSGPLAPRLAIACTKQAAHALAYLHQNGVIHRDVKPANLVLTQEGLVKLIDLGLARISDGSAGSITRLFGDKLLGTADYMSPEQALDCHLVDPRTDIYSLGCTLYFLLAGRAPFFGDTLAAKLMEHQACAPPVLEYRDGISARLVALCQRMMAKRPGDRFENATEVAHELAGCEL